ncbi:AlpA family phage regulatory protein [Aeromonas caviae]|nr:AlpA family phage regulatory protein [Aeromonas caviae]WEE20644.1 AlpA family phage regulatory protein [Aeromonas caviae]
MSTTIKILRTKDLIAKIGMARSTIYDSGRDHTLRFNGTF